MRSCFRRLTAASLLLASMASLPAAAQTPLFTYQGKLELNGSAVTGAADFQFRLFDSSSTGNQIGSTLTFNGMNVADGLFTANLDFGSGSFDGSARFLEIATRSPAGTGNFVILTPRQRITSAPYATFAGVAATSNRPWVLNGNGVDLSYTNGKVGIGTSSPTNLLELAGARDALRIRGPEPIINFADSSVSNSRVQLQDAGGRFFITSESFIAGTNGGAFTMFDTQGKIGIGTFNPTSRVEIAAQDGLTISGFQPFLTLKDTNAGGARALFSTANGDIGLYSNAAIARQFPSVIIKDNDWVGMGVGTPGFRLDLPNIGNNDGRARANRWDTYSSIRWKDNVQTLTGALDTVMHLRGVSFDWKPEHGGTPDIGFVAEEVGKVVPQLVSWEKDGQWAQGLAYDHITAITVEAIKEQQNQIEALKQANAELRDQVTVLMRAVASHAAETAAK